MMANLDFEDKPWQTFAVLFLARFAIQMHFGWSVTHPDQFWQGSEIAYYLAYSDELSISFTWEWLEDYKLRSIIFPLYLSLPLHVLRFLRIDTNFLVVNSIGAMNSVIQAVGDVYLYKLAKVLIGKRGALIALVFSFVNLTMTQTFTKTLTNGAEAICSLIAFYYFTHLQAKFDRNMKLMTLFITLAFHLRSSSLVGWIPLAMIKAFTSREYFAAIVQAALTVAVPVTMSSILADSLFYGKFTVAPYNFVYVNVVENLSRYFGEEPYNYYLHEFRPFIAVKKEIQDIVFFGFCCFSVYQFNGMLQI